METICNINPSSGTLAISGLLTVLALSPPHCKDGSKLQVHFSLLFLSSAEHWLRTSRTLPSSASCTRGRKSSTSPFQSHTQVYCDTSLCYVRRDDHLPHSVWGIIEHLVLLGQAECAVERDDTKYKNKHN